MSDHFGFFEISQAYPGTTSLLVYPQPVMTVATDDPLLPEPGEFGPYEHYQSTKYCWRALTYKQYTGRGWGNETLEEARYDAGQSLPKTSAKGRRELRQTFSLFAWGDQVAYAASDPLRLDVPYRARWRASGDLVGLEAQARQYGPTAACSIFEREGAEPSQALPALPPPPRSLTKKLPGEKIWAGVGLLLAGVLLSWVWERWLRLGRMSGPALMAAIYRRLARHGSRFGVPRLPSDTPGEYGHRLALAVARRAEQPHWRRRPLADRSQGAMSHLATLERTYLKATYSQHPLTEDERHMALSAWRELAPRLWLIWLGGKAQTN